LSREALTQVLRQLPQRSDPRLIVGASTSDDAGVFRLGPRIALVQTVDFFTPIVDDPFLYGQIAAANSLSDVYAMGGRPLTAMNLLGAPADRLPLSDVREILRGGALKVKEAGCVLVGGHSIRNPEPVYGLSVTGLVDPRRVMTNANARPGDHLVLTKPLGTGILTTGIKRGLAAAAPTRKAIRFMRLLNSVGAELAERGWVRAGTDVTGFGLLGHLVALCRSSGVGALVDSEQLPVIDRQIWDLIAGDCIPGGSRENLRAAGEYTRFTGVTDARMILATDAQTSGGLLLCVPERRLGSVLGLLRLRRTPCAAVIGRIVKDRRCRITVTGTG
jgi:selenide, water dikinase